MKIHFAGSESEKVDELIYDVGIKYRLNSYFYLKNKTWPKLKQLNNFTHVIIDSGLFTMMFGSGNTVELNEENIRIWMNNYIDFINRNHFTNADFVECDVQKILSSELAWDLRREMKSKINKGNIINVYHLPDGNPDKLIEYSDYIAISLPELRLELGKKEMYELTKYICLKAVQKHKRVHLLGCTEKKYLENFSYCYSADSTSWLSGLRYGEIKSDSFNLKYNDIRTERDPDTQMLALLFQDDYRKLTNSQT